MLILKKRKLTLVDFYEYFIWPHLGFYAHMSPVLVTHCRAPHPPPVSCHHPHEARTECIRSIQRTREFESLPSNHLIFPYSNAQLCNAESFGLDTAGRLMLVPAAQLIELARDSGMYFSHLEMCNAAILFPHWVIVRNIFDCEDTSRSYLLSLLALICQLQTLVRSRSHLLLPDVDANAEEVFEVIVTFCFLIILVHTCR
ncbi:hypothetical protein DFJ58DRAFT_689530 [Suillus subalutaceus]|uniref:uncharacterized protein n=1 Tax=Suillus subalutaceus TaxID=48586 RepID=UPI001B8723AD|nr:uncharacterized protein DFJ58DRAFT_689530 [Suillus subalutaceus]KAG1839637.1 hypothetical protein DFJ58DRAFT_689530 [Suillus subalutaceus]